MRWSPAALQGQETTTTFVGDIWLDMLCCVLCDDVAMWWWCGGVVVVVVVAVAYATNLATALVQPTPVGPWVFGLFFSVLAPPHCP
jgi:hypothetical protein